MSLSSLPFELFIDFPLGLINSLCRTNVHFNNIICNNEDFWRSKFIRDFKFIPEEYEGSWKELYREYNNVYIFGNINVPNIMNYIKAQQVSCSYNHIGLIDMDNKVWMFGDNEYGELGLGDNQ